MDNPETNEDGTFTLSDYRWSNRTLLVFAPSKEHPGYQKQLQAVKDHRAAFEERDMVLITVVDSNLGHAGETTLTPDDIRGLRVKFGIDTGEFAVLLIGKDGGEKRRETSFTEMQTIFDQIDSMPMRQDEMEKELPERERQ